MVNLIVSGAPVLDLFDVHALKFASQFNHIDAFDYIRVVLWIKETFGSGTRAEEIWNARIVRIDFDVKYTRQSLFAPQR